MRQSGTSEQEAAAIKSMTPSQLCCRRCFAMSSVAKKRCSQRSYSSIFQASEMLSRITALEARNAPELSEHRVVGTSEKSTCEDNAW